VNTDESFLASAAAAAKPDSPKRFVDKATATHGADFGLGLDLFSKRQILSPSALHREQAAQVDATAATSDAGT
jgi:hypothetical protein